jgi:hypothetical protein
MESVVERLAQEYCSRRVMPRAKGMTPRRRSPPNLDQPNARSLMQGF